MQKIDMGISIVCMVNSTSSPEPSSNSTLSKSNYYTLPTNDICLFNSSNISRVYKFNFHKIFYYITRI
jgi:hypothetical protein